MMTPFAYRVMDIKFPWKDETHVGLYRSLEAAVAAAKGTGLGPDDVLIFAAMADGVEQQIEANEYSEPNPPTVEEAERFVHERAQRIAAGHPWAQVGGIFRCNPADPTEQQIAEYIATAPRKWKKQVS